MLRRIYNAIQYRRNVIKCRIEMDRLKSEMAAKGDKPFESKEAYDKFVSDCEAIVDKLEEGRKKWGP